MRTVRSVQLQTRRIQLKGFTTRKQDSKRPEQITEDTPANPGRLLGVGGSAGDTGFGLRTNDRAPRRGRPSRKLEERTASPGSPETIERTAGCGRQSPEPQPGEGVAPAPASKPIPTGAGDDPEPRSRRRRSASRVIRVQATEPSEARTRAQAGYGTALRSTAESAGRMRSVERQIRSPEKLTGASRKATRGSVAPRPSRRCWPASRRWQKIPLRRSPSRAGSGGICGGIYSAAVTGARPSVCRPCRVLRTITTMKGQSKMKRIMALTALVSVVALFAFTSQAAAQQIGTMSADPASVRRRSGRG